ncbi:30S ribosomal protein S16 [Candidatus Saccharibacteria bacterium]|nr:30S ribosomal protein S16 [Candidatus Saccharibacteria bacterium]MBI2285598.1 30S ribosomal protein S16 [Candidatus Saccharibacteria bacterium]
MLAIRMQRVGRSGHAQFRMIVQDRRFHPSSGRVVAYLGNYNPHTKESSFDKEKLESFLAKGAQPSPRVIKLLKAEKVKLPEWVNEPVPKEKAVRNPDKRRSTRPEGMPEPAAKASVEETSAVEESAEPKAEPETPAETPKTAEPPVKQEESTPGVETEQAAEDTPTEEAPAEPTETPEKPAG